MMCMGMNALGRVPKHPLRRRAHAHKSCKLALSLEMKNCSTSRLCVRGFILVVYSKNRRCHVKRMAVVKSEFDYLANNTLYKFTLKSQDSFS